MVEPALGQAIRNKLPQAQQALAPCTAAKPQLEPLPFFARIVAARIGAEKRFQHLHQPLVRRNVDPVFLQLKEKLDGISLKPEKGRRKDLRKIEDAVRAMRKIAFSDKKAD